MHLMGSCSKELHKRTGTCVAALYCFIILSFWYISLNIHLESVLQFMHIDYSRGYELVADHTLLSNKPDSDIFRESRNVVLVNCRKLFEGDQYEMIKAYNLTKTNDSGGAIGQEYLSITESCESFREKRAYIMSPLTSSEESFPLAYSILMYRDVYQVERLLRTIYRPQNIYCIHVDSKAAKDVKYTMKKIASCFDNVFIASQSFDVRWGKMTVIEPEMMCMKDLLARNKRWKYFINLTGQEFPLRTNYELVKILMVYDGANDIQGSRHSHWQTRWEKAGVPPHNIRPSKGNVHIVANRDFVDFLVNNKTAKDFYEWTNHTEVPDETFFSSMNHNPHLVIRGQYLGDVHVIRYKLLSICFAWHLSFISFLCIQPREDKREGPDLPDAEDYFARLKIKMRLLFAECHGKVVRDICIPGVGDLPFIKMSKKFFVNKIHWDYQSFVLDCMEELIYNTTRDEYLGLLDFDTSVYKQAVFVQKKVS